MLWIYIAGMLGIFRYRGLGYWKWVGILAAWLFVLQFLFYGGGTLADPRGDGLITHQLRVATKDGPGMAVFAIVFLIAYWGGLIFIIRKLYAHAKEAETAQYQEEWDSDERVLLGRKLAEAATLTLVGGIWLYVFVLAAMPSFQPSEPVPQVSNAAPVSAPDEDPIARQLAEAAAEGSRDLPKMVDATTKLKSMSTEGRTFIYHYEMTRRDAPDAAIIAFVRKKVIPKACSNKDMAAGMKDYGIVYRYSYLMPNADKPLEVDATWSNCSTPQTAP